MTGTESKEQKKSFNNLFKNGEEVKAISCSITGTIPSWLSGGIIRNGPGEFKIGEDTFEHWFDGHALLHKFDVENGQVTYSSNFIKNKDYKKNHECNKIVVGTFGTACVPDPCKSVFSRFFSKFISRKPNTENANVNVIQLGPTNYAITDGPMAQSINSTTLEAVKFHDFTEMFDMFATVAHPHFDLNGDFYTLGLHGGRKGFYGIYKIPVECMTKGDAIQELKLHSQIPNDRPLSPCYFHSFALSENHITIHDQCVRFNVLKVLKASFTWDSLMTVFEHHPESESVFHVVDKHKQVKLSTKYCSKARFCFHHINSFEQTANGTNFLVIDMLCADGPTFFYFWLRMLKDAEAIEGKDRPRMWPLRFVLPLAIDSAGPTGKNLVTIDNCSAKAELREDGSVFLTPELLVEENFAEKFDCSGLELPAINYKQFNTKPYNFMYCTGEERVGLPCFLFKINVQTKETWKWSEKNCYPSEPIFVKNPKSTEEDGGVLLSTVISNNPDDPIFLLILDAQSFTEIARAEINVKLPYPLHATFLLK